jgi:hypothetical protein
MPAGLPATDDTQPASLHAFNTSIKGDMVELSDFHREVPCRSADPDEHCATSPAADMLLVYS